jgi:RNA polymerase sigma-70 factor, ECF subfamily
MTTHLSLFAEYRAYLYSLAQRLLGSALDAEDLLQETFIRWQQTSLAQIRSPKAFLSTVVKRLCLNQLQSARVRREECVGSDFPEPASEDPSFKNAIESVVPALLILLERLSPKERVVLLLRDVFDCDYEEIAPVISKSAANCRQLLRRARQHLGSGESRFSVSPEQLQAIARQFTRSCTTGDINGLVSVLS